MAMQYGGWYDNPATGRNQRWFNGIWTDGGEPESSSPSPNNNQAYTDSVNNLTNEVNSYIDSLTNLAQGDYDFIAKWIESNYQEAVGKDDKDTARFLKTVASEMENKVGRLRYDYNTQKYQLEEDKGTATTRLNQDVSTALSRLKEDQSILTEQYKRDAAKARSQQGSSLNERGILASTREDAQGLAGKEVGDLEREIQDRFSALERAYGRDTADYNQSLNRGLFDINQGFSRGMESLNTGVRRGIIDQQQSRDYNTEQAKLDFEKRKKQLEAERSSSLREIPGLAALEAYNKMGY